MAIKIGHASGSENGTIKGKAGDQTGREVYTRGWYKHSKGWVTLRCKDPAMREQIAVAMEKACANNDIGYNQYENQTLYNNIKENGFDPSKTTKKVNTDCARLVRVCCQYACEQVKNGVIIPDFYTASEASTLVKTGLFEKLTDSKYNTQDAYLLRGDIQVTKTKGHTFVILQNGSKSGSAPVQSKPTVYHLGDRILRNGVEGEDVKEYQEMLIQAGGDLSPWGADGDFGDTTELETRKIQKLLKIDIDGEVGPQTIKALTEYLADKVIVNAKKIKIINGKCYVRPEPNTQNKPFGTAQSGQEFEYLGETSTEGWNKIKFENKEGWVSGKYSELI